VVRSLSPREHLLGITRSATKLDAKPVFRGSVGPSASTIKTHRPSWHDRHCVENAAVLSDTTQRDVIQGSLALALRSAAGSGTLELGLAGPMLDTQQQPDPRADLMIKPLVWVPFGGHSRSVQVL